MNQPHDQSEDRPTKPGERPDRTPRWWPDFPYLRPHSNWPWPANPKYKMPHVPGQEGWDTDPWIA